jgi:hypothetical protein
MGYLFLQGTPAAAQGGFAGPGRYEIENVASGKVLQLSRDDGTTVVQFTREGSPEQHWEIEKAQGKYFFIRSVKTRKALEIRDGLAQDGAAITTGELTGKRHQQWRFEPGAGGSVLIISALEKALDVPRSSTENNLPLVAFRPHGEVNQQFVLRKVGDSTGRPESETRAPRATSRLPAATGFVGPGRYVIEAAVSGKVLGLNREDGTTVAQFPWSGDLAQQWDIQVSTEGYVFIRSALNGKALDVMRDSDHDATPVTAYTFHGRPNQRWRIEARGATCLIVSRVGKPLEIIGGLERDGARVQIYRPDGSKKQEFILRRLDTAESFR